MATYLPEGYLRLRLRCQLIAKATHLRCATVRQASVLVTRYWLRIAYPLEE
jgi:hypothetical protein